jgi:hypothetical protein
VEAGRVAAKRKTEELPDFGQFGARQNGINSLSWTELGTAIFLAAGANSS